MKARYRALGLILPLLLADATSMLYSTDDWEREFMVKSRELLEIYSDERPIDRSDHDYPNRFFKEDGPVPILIASEMKLPFAPIIARPMVEITLHFGAPTTSTGMLFSPCDR